MAEKFLVLLSALYLLLAAGSIAWAQEFEGQKELAISGNLSTVEPSEGETTTSLSVNFSLATFTSDDLQVGGFANILAAGTGDQGFFSTFYGLLIRKYFFDESAEKAFYIGPHFGIINIIVLDLEGSGFAFGGFAGAKFFLSENQTLFVEYRLTQTDITFDDTETGESFDVSLTQTDISVGFSVFFD